MSIPPLSFSPVSKSNTICSDCQAKCIVKLTKIVDSLTIKTYTVYQGNAHFVQKNYARLSQKFIKIPLLKSKTM